MQVYLPDVLSRQEIAKSEVGAYYEVDVRFIGRMFSYVNRYGHETYWLPPTRAAAAGNVTILKNLSKRLDKARGK